MYGVWCLVLLSTIGQQRIKENVEKSTKISFLQTYLRNCSMRTKKTTDRYFPIKIPDEINFHLEELTIIKLIKYNLKTDNNKNK